jgi:hypothetical protein
MIRTLVLSVLGLLLPYSARADQEPDWVKKRPPRTDAYLGIGFAQSSGKPEADRKRADDDAIANVAKEIKVAVKSVFTDIAKEQTSGGQTVSSQQVSSFTETKVDQVLPGVMIEARWHDEKKGEYWSYAVIERKKVNIKPLALKVNVVGKRMVGQEMVDVVVQSGSKLKSKDNLRVYFETNQKSYVYMLIFDSEKKASVLFPDPRIAVGNQVQGGVEYQIPPGDDWFWLDEHPGTETIYVIASYEPLTELKKMLDALEGQDAPARESAQKKLEQQVAVMQRGIGGIGKVGMQRYDIGGGKQVQRLTEVVTGLGGALRVISIQHE